MQNSKRNQEKKEKKKKKKGKKDTIEVPTYAGVAK